MTRFFALTLALCAAFASCKSDSKSTSGAGASDGVHASPDLLGGHWIALDFCSRAGQYGSVLQAGADDRAPYAFALTFNPGEPDSVLCHNGFESWKRAVQYKVDTLEIKEARPGKSIFLMYNPNDKDMVMFDGTGGRTQMDRFIKSRAGMQDGFAAFRVALNHHILGGQMKPLFKGAADKTLFTPGGQIQGWPAFDRYEICINGDCFVADEKADIIRLSNSKTPEDPGKTFAFRLSAQNDSLLLYNLNPNPNADEKGGMTRGSTAYRFLFKKQ